MAYTFESYDTELTPDGINLPREIFETETGEVMVYPSPYMTVRISDSRQFECTIAAMDRLPEKHRQTILRQMYGKAIHMRAQNKGDAVYIVMSEISTDKSALFKSGKPIPVRVENCGEYVQITAK